MLLVLNLIAVAGFVLFLAKCRPIAVRSGDAFHEIRPRAEVANLSAHSASPIQDAVLKRLSLLEDIVYRQLNGLSKSLGLIEGYGGRGKGGLPATLSRLKKKRLRDPMRSMATIPTSVRKFHWTVPFRIIVPPSVRSSSTPRTCPRYPSYSSS